VLRWKLREKGLFDAQSFYSVLRGSNELRFPWKGIWGVKAPRRVSFFVWTAAWGKILICDNLMRRGYVLTGLCCMCRRDWEKGDHLLIHCALARDLWCSILNSFGNLWVIPEKVVDLLFGWFNWFRKHNSEVWNLVPLCLMWTVWQERNRRTFEDAEQSGSKLIELFYGLLFDWSRVWGHTTTSSLADFVISLGSIHSSPISGPV
jgi:hypothetical protein